MKRSKIYIVTSVYNESMEIGNVIRDIKKSGYKNIVVVDDGSVDDTYNQISKYKNIILARHIYNRGAGAGIQTGNEIALEAGAEVIVNIDGDGQHNVSDISTGVGLLIKKQLDIVLGSRYLRKNTQKDIPLVKKYIIHKLGILFTLLVSRVKLTDNHNGFRVMTAQTAKRLDIQHDGYEYCSEIQDKLRVLNLKFAEFPVKVKYTRTNQIHSNNKAWNAVGIVYKFLLSKILT